MYRIMWLPVWLMILQLLFLYTHAQFDFNPPCSCEGSYCECCINAIIQEGCLRLTLTDDSVRISFVLNGDDLGGFSFQTSGAVKSPSLTLRLRRRPGTSLSLRLRNQRTTSSGRRFCLNVQATTRIRTLYDKNFCFDINGNALTSVVNG